ncbi:Putative K(+)-stimulated pyrophosphate-energized sodium pump [Geodia barretti]|uniref:H(+)-exporting diphosphatase n=1 Tax=Geodia barretti TaxID=519541 RepID=A0AA35RHX0_GEOBA|nr:Putative K(+)-stimulated pyrophosphate-energized sodium pump [Geodia barretti]
MILALGAGGLALAFAAVTAARVLSADKGTAQVQAIGNAIQEGANAFLRREYMTLLPFALIVTVALAILDYTLFTHNLGLPATAISYVAGTICSGLAGIVGMNVAVRANVRTASAAQRGLNPALRVAFSSGTVMGVTVVGIGLLGVTTLYLVFQNISAVAGFGFGASSIALFARVGGGIFTKAADVGSDLVGKIEAGIPEDDPRNPGVIADNVGDNVGDVAGMGADLFESYVGSIISAVALSASAVALAVGASGGSYTDPQSVFPMLLAGAGIIAAILGPFVVRSGEQADFERLLWALRYGIFTAGGLLIVFAAILTITFTGYWSWFGCVVAGLVAGTIIGLATEYYTSYSYMPTKRVSESSQTGAATVIISRIATGMLSTLIPVVCVSVAILLAYWFAGFYGVALAGVGLLSTLGITLATDAYGPVADNAGGIAEQAQLDPEVRERTDALDALGNTTAATGKGFAIGSAALTALALLAAYSVSAKLITLGEDGRLATGSAGINLLQPQILVGLIIGAMLPFLFSALTMQAVGRAAQGIVDEVRRQFREIPGLMEGTAQPDSARCVDISTRSALREMILPGVMAVVAPIATGFILGEAALGGLLIGAVSSGFMLAIMMASAGGSWDNAKKYVELGNFGGKGSDAHKAAVEGDVVGDPFKDTSGPSLNILLKLMAIVSLVFAPVFLKATPLINLA